MTKQPPRVRMLGNRVSSIGRLASPSKKVAEHYSTPEHKAWRRTVMERAGWRCEAVDNGQRCQCRAPAERLFADHKIEVTDNPSLALAPDNGQALCGSHHVSKTNAERARRNGIR